MREESKPVNVLVLVHSVKKWLRGQMLNWCSDDILKRVIRASMSYS
jgi:hypothetical protein